MTNDDYLLVDENHRLGWGYDEDADNPASWGNIVVVPRPQGYWNRRRDQAEAQGDDWLNVDGAYRHFLETVNGSEETEAVIRWARIFHDTTVVYDSGTDAFWYLPESTKPADWGRLWLDQYHQGDPRRAEAAIIDSEISQYNQWAQGSVYFVYGQVRRVEHIEVTDPVRHGVIRTYEQESWETEDALHGIYQEDRETFEDMMRRVANENFDGAYYSEP